MVYNVYGLSNPRKASSGTRAPGLAMFTVLFVLITSGRWFGIIHSVRLLWIAYLQIKSLLIFSLSVLTD